MEKREISIIENIFVWVGISVIVIPLWKIIHSSYIQQLEYQEREFFWQRIKKILQILQQNQNVAAKNFGNIQVNQVQPLKPEIPQAKEIKTVSDIGSEKDILNGFIFHPCVILIIGWRGSGKSALAWKIMDILRWNVICYGYKIPAAKRSLLPWWCTSIDEISKIPNNCGVLIDEAYIFFHSRDASLKQSKELSNFINLSRQKRQTIIIVSQQSRQIDINLAGMVDVIFVKEPGIINFERSQFDSIIEMARKNFSTIQPEERKKYVFAYCLRDGKNGFFSVDLPSFWKEEMSYLFDSVNNEDREIDLQKLTKEERNNKIRQYRQQHPEVSIRQLARIFDVSPGTIVNILKDYPYNKKEKGDQ